MITDEVKCNFCIQQKSCRRCQFHTKETEDIFYCNLYEIYMNYNRFNMVERVNASEQEDDK